MLLLTLFFAFIQVGLFSVGGGYAAIPLIQEQIVNIHKLNESSGTRLLDYLTGVTFAIKGSFQKVDNNVFLFAPNDMPVDGKVEACE